MIKCGIPCRTASTNLPKSSGNAAYGSGHNNKAIHFLLFPVPVEHVAALVVPLGQAASICYAASLSPGCNAKIFVQ